MAFVLTLMYVAFSLLSPSVLPDIVTRLHVNEVLGVLVLLALLPEVQGSKIGSIPDPYVVLGVFVAACVSIIATGWLGHALDIVLGFAPILLVFYFVLISCRSLSRLRTLVFVLLGVGFFILAQAAIADHSGNVTSDYLVAERNPLGGWVYRYKGLGVLSDPNDLCQLFTMVLPLLWLQWKPGKYARNTLLVLLPAAILLVGVFHTHSRGGIIAVLAVCLFGFKDKLGVTKSVLLAAVLFAGVIALNATGGRGMNDDDGGRVAAWITGLELFKTHPLFGIGIGNFGQYTDTGNTAHNSYVLSLAELGLFGYFFWMGSIVTAWSGLSFMLKTQAKEKETAPDTSTPPPPAHLAYIRPMLHASPVPALAVPAQARVMTALPYASPGPAIAVPAQARVMTAAPYTSHAHMPRNWAAPRSDSAGSLEDPSAEHDDPILGTARLLRVALVGLLTSSFFLSRSFSMVFYILLGMAAALKLTYRQKYPELIVKDPALAKRIWITILVSIVLLYAFVRIRGVG